MMEKQEEHEATGPGQEEPQQELPTSELHVTFTAPGIAGIKRMEATGQVSNGQMAYLGFVLFAQAFHEIGAPLLAGIVQGVLVDTMKPKIETARAGFNIPPGMLKPS